MSTDTVATQPVVPTADAIAEAARHLASGDTQAALDRLRNVGEADASSLRLRFLAGLIAWRLADVQQAISVLRA